MKKAVVVLVVDCSRRWFPCSCCCCCRRYLRSLRYSESFDARSTTTEAQSDQSRVEVKSEALKGDSELNVILLVPPVAKLFIGRHGSDSFHNPKKMNNLVKITQSMVFLNP